MTMAEQIEKWGLEKGIIQGMQKGMQKGEHEKAVAIAKNMLSKGMKLNLIKELTGLSVKELKDL
jgi:predicted transposase/invertase (TIGR01784 family)